MIKILAACGAGVNSSHQIKSALEEELSNLGFEPGIPVIEAGPILFRIPAMSAPVFDNIEAAIKEHGLS
ncbi:PTS system IIB component (galactitol/fructose specific) [Streptococcus pneumoniae]|uniref:hypothetical protein n=1 Tax=Streptococcus pneumoniae TaxID=1313 RepID=UPI000766BAE3|nr:hypothetical protein [Streptococcus pneumoniae]VIZ60899.1 PTS system IIB component (galactitol/fructose specific) [Streptococcus pneumoniae]